MSRATKILSKVSMSITVEELNKKLEYYAGRYPEFDVFYDGDLQAIVGLPKEG